MGQTELRNFVITEFYEVRSQVSPELAHKLVHLGWGINTAIERLCSPIFDKLGSHTHASTLCSGRVRDCFWPATMIPWPEDGWGGDISNYVRRPFSSTPHKGGLKG